METETAPGEAIVSPEDAFSRHVKQLVDNFFTGDHPRFCPLERAWNPPTDIFETADAVHIKMEVAGVTESDIDVKVNDTYLIIRGRRDDDRNLKRENFHLMEIQYGHFERVFRLPMHMETHDVTAALRNGFLIVSIPRDRTLREFRILIE